MMITIVGIVVIVLLLLFVFAFSVGISADGEPGSLLLALVILGLAAFFAIALPVKTEVEEAVEFTKSKTDREVIIYCGDLNFRSSNQFVVNNFDRIDKVYITTRRNIFGFNIHESVSVLDPRQQ
jgi:hypothetical protein